MGKMLLWNAYQFDVETPNYSLIHLLRALSPQRRSDALPLTAMIAIPVLRNRWLTQRSYMAVINPPLLLAIKGLSSLMFYLYDALVALWRYPSDLLHTWWALSRTWFQVNAIFHLEVNIELNTQITTRVSFAANAILKLLWHTRIMCVWNQTKITTKYTWIANVCDCGANVLRLALTAADRLTFDWLID